MNFQEASLRTSQYLNKTPLLHSLKLSKMLGANVYLKLESEQITGSFKARGALNKILKSTGNKVFVTASTGNHALGFANALQYSDATGIIFMPNNASKAKVELLSDYSVELKLYGDECLSTELEAKRFAQEMNYIYVSPYNDVGIIEGQGTVAVEVFQELENVDRFYACIGGGGLMSGCSEFIKSNHPETKVIGCLPENSPEMYLSVQKGEIIELENPKDTLSDGSAGGLEPGSITFDFCKKNVDDYILASEEEIAKAIKMMIDVHHKIIEGAAGVALASMLKDDTIEKGENIVVVICGSNVSTEVLKSIL